jgi:hypothetical protein
MILIAIYVAEVAAVLGSLGTARTGGALFRCWPQSKSVILETQATRVTASSIKSTASSNGKFHNVNRKFHNVNGCCRKLESKQLTCNHIKSLLSHLAKGNTLLN